MARLVIAGGGIGGLAAALAQARGGHDVLVLERAPVFAEIGAGIQLAPNAFTALAQLGIGEEVRAGAVHIDELRLVSGISGETLVRLPLGSDYQERFTHPYVVLHRADLHGVLLRACRDHPRIALRAGTEVTSYRTDSLSVRCVLASGEQIKADALIGADGLRSQIRCQMLDDGDPRPSGHTIYRAAVPTYRVPRELRSNRVTLWAGPGWHFVHYPIAGGRLMNLAITKDDQARTVLSGRPTRTSHVLTQFSDLHRTGQEMLALGDDWRAWVLCDRPPVRRWNDGRVVLLGDAAHPMLQYAAQGACMALEDAVVLGHLLRCGSEEIPERLQRYVALRRDRTAAAQRDARWMGHKLYHPAGEHAAARDRQLAALTPEALFDVVARYHAWSPELATV